MENNRTKGSRYEQRAVDYLEAAGLTILARNYKVSRFEIDIVARENNTIVFTEVKYRADARFGSGAEAVDAGKRFRIRKAAKEYLYQTKTPQETACRFDVIFFSGEKLMHIREAF